jgi:hypothetical protein
MLHAIHDVVLRFGIADQHTNDRSLRFSSKVAVGRCLPPKSATCRKQ